VTRTGRASRRDLEFFSERLAGARDAQGAGEDEPAAGVLLEQRLDHRRRLAERTSDAGLGGIAAVVDATPGAANWIPLGPYAVTQGQAGGLPVVSGRIPDLAISDDGNRLYAASANGGVWRSVDAGRSWQPMSDSEDIDPTGAGFVITIPGPPALGRQSGVDTQSCGALALIDGGAADQDTLYLGTGERFGGSSSYTGVGVYRSSNGGFNWTREATGPVPNLLDGQGFFGIAVDPSDADLAVGATTRGIWRRSTSAAPPTWQQDVVPNPAGAPDIITAIAVKRITGDTQFFVARYKDRIYTATTGGGMAWADLAIAGFPAADVGRVTLAICQGSANILYALISDTFKDANDDRSGQLLGLWRLDLDAPAASQQWRQVSGLPEKLFGETSDDSHAQGEYDQALAVDPNNPNVVYVGGSTVGSSAAALYRIDITISGATVSGAKRHIGDPVHPDVHVVRHAPGRSDVLWVGCDGGLWVTNNPTGQGSSLFEARNTGLGILTPNGLDQHPSNPSYFFCGVQDNGGVRYTGSEVWEHQLGGDGGDTVVRWDDPTELLNIYTNASIRNADIDGSRWSSSSASIDLEDGETTRFYSPMVGAPNDGNSAHGARVAFGGERIFVSENFGGDWSSIPNDDYALDAFAPTTQTRCIAFTAFARLFAGTADGRVFMFEETAAGWQPPVALGSPPGIGSRPITSIALDTRDATGKSIWVTVGGPPAGLRRVFQAQFSVGPPQTWAWTNRSGAGANVLIDSQHNKIIVDPDNALHLWVGADVGVWESTDAGVNWTAAQSGLPDTAVLDLDIFPTDPNVKALPVAQQPAKRLRATLHGRGMWELPIDGNAIPNVELYLRTNVLDTGRGPVPLGAALPRDPGETSATHPSPDIIVDPPNSQGGYALDPNGDIDLVEFFEAFSTDVPSVVANVPEAVVTTKIHVNVRNRSRFPVEDVQVMLLVGLMSDDGDMPALPAGFEGDVQAGTIIDTSDWKTVGIRTLSGVVAGNPLIATFDLRSDILPPADDSAGDTYVILALLHAQGDAFAGTDTGVDALVTNERRAAMRVVEVKAATGAAVSATSAGAGSALGAGPISEASGRRGPSVLIPTATVLLAHKRLSDVSDALERRINTSKVQTNLGSFGASTTEPAAIERQVLTLANAARDMFRGGPAAPPNPNVALSGVGAFPMLGAVGFEIPAFASVFAPGGDWVSEAIRRGTPDPHRSLVDVASADFSLEVGRIALTKTTDPEIQARIRATTMGLFAATSAGAIVSPQMVDLLALETNRDWGRWAASGGASATDELIRRRMFPGLKPAEIANWWPAVGQVPDELWEGYLEALAGVHNLPDGPRSGFADGEPDFGDWLTPARMSNAYAMYRNNLGTSSWPWPAWWGILTPMMLGPPIAMLAARALPNAGKFFVPGEQLDERAVFEMATLGLGIGSVSPLVYSMILWGFVGDFHEPFINALVMGIARAVLTGVGLGADMDGLGRWLGIFAPMVSLDVYAAIRSIVAASNERPGPSFVFGLQTIPSITSIATLIFSMIAKLAVDKADDEWPYWLVLIIATLGLWLGLGIGMAVPLSHGGGFWSWFMRDDRRFGLEDALKEVAGQPVDPVALARVFEDSAMWVDPQTQPPAAAGLEHHAYPSGMRGLVRVWVDDGVACEIRHDDGVVALRPDGLPPVEVSVDPAGTTQVELAALLDGAVPSLHAVAVGPDDPQYTLPWPATVADPGDAGPRIDHVTAKDRFVALPDDEDEAYVLRHAPRIEHSIGVGLTGDPFASVEAFPVVPIESGGDLEGTGLGAAADLTLLLAMASVPTLNGGTASVDDGLPDLPPEQKDLGEVAEVFRKWNLDDRRLNEWRMLVAGGAKSEKLGDAETADPLMRERSAPHRGDETVAGEELATAMGWIPMWRAWIRMASDPGADTGADIAMPYSTQYEEPDGTIRRPTNAELSTGVRYLLELRG
jgi:hypothetical protein